MYCMRILPEMKACTTHPFFNFTLNEIREVFNFLSLHPDQILFVIPACRIIGPAHPHP